MLPCELQPSLLPVKTSTQAGRQVLNFNIWIFEYFYCPFLPSNELLRFAKWNTFFTSPLKYVCPQRIYRLHGNYYFVPWKPNSYLHVLKEGKVFLICNHCCTSSVLWSRAHQMSQAHNKANCENTAHLQVKSLGNTSMRLNLKLSNDGWGSSILFGAQSYGSIFGERKPSWS